MIKELAKTENLWKIAGWFLILEGFMLIALVPFSKSLLNFEYANATGFIIIETIKIILGTFILRKKQFALGLAAILELFIGFIYLSIQSYTNFLLPLAFIFIFINIKLNEKKENKVITVKAKFNLPLFLWKICFFILLFLYLITIFFELGNVFKWTFMDWISWLSAIPFMLGLFLYSFQKKFISYKFWRIFFWFLILFHFYDLLLIYTPIEKILKIPSFLLYYQSYDNYGFFGLIFYTIFSIPLYAFYQLGYKKEASN